MRPRLTPPLRRAWIHRPRIDRDLARYLVRGEDVVVQVRRHPFCLTGPVLAGVAATLATFWLDLNAPDGEGGRGLTNVAWAVWFAVMGWMVWRVANWRRDFFVATDKRFLLFYGFVIRRVAMMPLTKVTDMTFNRTIMGRLFGYGSFVLESAGHDQALSRIDFVPHAQSNYQAICEVLFGAEDDDGWDEEQGGPDEWDDGWDDDGDDGWDDGPDDGDGWDPADDGPDGRGRAGSGTALHMPDGWEPARRPRRPRQRRARPRRSPTPTSSERQGEPEGVSIYRSADLVQADRDADTGEIPVVGPIRYF